ncbi:serine hydrolase domain-containing protein [Aliiglaciecola lipolytica]|uniref:Beta-lactamase-related domain-containing protein n=1 Tax=Aliiglaciecola lipolytica E3 TaxID=1127673 RepID=K6WXT2_9ALTE|nr:serine hydrolase domain-containing protein [Aliiglaciecola lipolytica]GAC13279.1 hypothetical protein GLIP_0633 [Aliiglaciecola lipolytica E3]
MQNRAVLFCISLFFLCLHFTAYAKNSAAEHTLESLFVDAVANETVPGISVAVADKNGIVWAKGYGFADLENHVAMTNKHKMRIGSIAKVITSAGLMRLYDKGKIDLDKPITEYVSYWPNSHPPITLRQLTSHTAGIRHYKKGADEFLLNKPFKNMQTSVALFQDDALLFPPGTAFAYSTFAWSLISAAMENADGSRSFEEIIQQEVFNPLNMQDSVFDHQYQIIDYRQRPYSVIDGKLYNSRQTDHSYKWAGGGIIASTSDISRFAVAHLKGKYLQPESVEMMFNKAALKNNEKVEFGIGWHIGFDSYHNNQRYKNDTEAKSLMAAMPNVVMHSGGSMGGTTMMILCTDHNRAVTVVKNVDGDQSVDVFLLALRTLSFYHQ